YKYNTFHRQKQEVLKPKKGVGCGKGCSPPIAISCFTFVTFVTDDSFAFIRSIREIRVQKQNVGFVFRFVYSFANARCVGFVFRFVYSFANARCVGF
ncbi:hypothetical protein, partial [Prevotellamassilia timonensis]|uniref:hypothetical protein n=1 Tax=Prevotellamassilia timonensis TaxID=1852370 RepID=UPI001F1B7891